MMMIRNTLKFVAFLLIILIGACGDDNPFFEEPGTSELCTNVVASTDTQSPFKVEINREEWIADSLIIARSDGDDRLVIEAISKKTDDEITRIRTEINNWEFGANNFDLRTSSQLLFEVIKDETLFISQANCGYVNLTEIDRGNNQISGTFQSDVSNRPTEPVNVSLANGVFNNLTLQAVYCQPEFENEAMDIDIFNRFKLIGIFELNDEIVSFPPCDTETTIQFEKSDLNGFERIDISGSTNLNAYRASVFNLDESSFNTDDFTITPITGLPHERTFEAQFIQLIANTRVTYTIEDNILNISNEALGRKLTFVKF